MARQRSQKPSSKLNLESQESDTDIPSIPATLGGLCMINVLKTATDGDLIVRTILVALSIEKWLLNVQVYLSFAVFLLSLKIYKS